MDVFALRDGLIAQYQAYVQGFVRVREPHAKAFVDDYFAGGRLWPEPLVQLNPSFQPGRSVDELVQVGILHRDCAQIFRRREQAGDIGRPIRLHQHQDAAIAAAQTGESYVLTTGTGSGKSLAYFVPIVDHILRAGAGNGIKAIVVYPMNALCNSQALALEQFLSWGFPGGRGPVRFARYTGQERDEQRQAIIAQPPDILLTNFVMLELILTRGDERALVEACQGLEFVVLDELHTYRGRQGADVAMLVRRLRERCGAPSMRCVGTSATLAGSGSREERQVEVARVASRLFGATVPPANVIGETLRRATQGEDPTPEALAAALRVPLPVGDDYESLARQPLAIWAEQAFGLARDAAGRYERRPPRTVSDVACELGALTGLPPERCVGQLRTLLLDGYRASDPLTAFPLFAFRLHQFVSRGDTVYATPEPPAQRRLSSEKQVFVPHDRDRRLYPLAFCRVCGQDYLVVNLPSRGHLLARELDERSEESTVESGFLVLETGELLDPLSDPQVLPEDWTEQRRGAVVIRSAARQAVPRSLRVDAAGQVLAPDEPGGSNAWFVPAPFRFCLCCGITYASGREKDFSRLAELSSEGRSTATTILSMAVVRALRQEPSLDREAQKLLSFTDNRQDASLQAGHFNDFVQVTLLRAAILAAVERAGPVGVGAEEIAQRVVEALALAPEEYASNPQAQFAARRATQDALREVAGYRVYHDLRRGWRVTSPNLEQVGLLQIDYEALDELCAADALWQNLHPALATARAQQREQVCRAFLDHLRRSLVLKAPYLEPQHQERIRQLSFAHLVAPWALDEGERLLEAGVLRLEVPAARERRRDDVYLTTRSMLGRYLRRADTWPELLQQGQRLPAEELADVAAGLVSALQQGGQLEAVPDLPGAYRLNAGVMRWRRGDGVVHHDPIRIPRGPAEDTAGNPFFAQLYHLAAGALHGLEAREHTAQVPSAEREKREERFGTGELPVLYCSPTMELGVDIRDLNAVSLRNVPPTPANYAQRSGRAGRSGQPALVLTYCTSNSPHDQYYFRRPDRMVAGAVVPPRLDLANEELLRAHVHAVWLAETGQSLFSSVSELLELSQPTLPLKEEVRAYIQRPVYQLSAERRCRQLFATLTADLTATRAPWFSPHWLTSTVQAAPLAFDQAAERWRHLYRSAQEQQERQHAIVADPLRSADDRRQAQRLRDEAETQLDLLRGGGRHDVFSDFYSYRYFATEGFLPGYNFPRLPVTAYIPARQNKKGDEEFLSRARFIAISEFGPRTIVYHEGSRYRVNRVVLPREEEGGGRTSSALFCTCCGYGHFDGRADVDVCERCGTPMNGSTSQRFSNLLRLESVSTYRVDRINCDEEERLRLGYEIRTIFRFAERDDTVPVTRAAVFHVDGDVAAQATYGPATTLRRVNLGWNRRKDKGTNGFNLDMERGVWSKSDQEPDSSDEESDPIAESPRRIERVVPFVEDRRNVLVLTPQPSLPPDVMLSLQYALKRGIEARYQLEESELAVEPLPTAAEPNQFLFFEAAEGGAGVLVRLAEEPQALAEVARQALRLCHFDPDSGSDLHRASGAPEDCEAACYDCLLGYSNQRYHDLLDRQPLRDLLLRLARSSGAVGSGGRSRPEQREQLQRACQSDLERDFLAWLETAGLRLPDRAQALVDGLAARPDFTYLEVQACVYVDGAPHHFPGRRQRDAAADTALGNLGWTVIRVEGPETWAGAAEQFGWVFGEGSGG